MKDKETEKRELADAIARGIFKIGDDPNSPCRRIQFMGGQWPGNERPQGGLVESALSLEIYGIIRESRPATLEGRALDALENLCDCPMPADFRDARALLREAGRVK